jgi:hypothetical protein
MELRGLLSNPHVRDDPLIELILACSDPEFLKRARHLSQRIEKLVKSGRSVPLPSPPKPRPGQVLSTIKLILLEHPDGLQTYEIRQLVEERLGRKLPRSTIKGTLSGRDEFERVERGHYQLRAHNF